MHPRAAPSNPPKHPPDKPASSDRELKATSHASNNPATRVPQMHLKKYVNGFRPENQRLRGKALDTTPLPFDRVDVWHQFKLNPTSLVDGEVWVETVKALPVWKHSTNTRFDTVIALVDDNAESTAVEGRCRVGRVRVIFQLPSELRKHGSRTSFVVPWKQEPLVYVEWYSNFRKSPDGPHGMYLVTKTKDSDGHPQGEVVEMARIRQPRHSQHGPSQDNTLPSLYFHDAQGKEQSASPPQHQPDSDPPGEPLPFDVSAQAEFQGIIIPTSQLVDSIQRQYDFRQDKRQTKAVANAKSKDPKPSSSPASHSNNVAFLSDSSLSQPPNNSPRSSQPNSNTRGSGWRTRGYNRGRGRARGRGNFAGGYRRSCYECGSTEHLAAWHRGQPNGGNSNTPNPNGGNSNVATGSNAIPLESHVADELDFDEEKIEHAYAAWVEYESESSEGTEYEDEEDIFDGLAEVSDILGVETKIVVGTLSSEEEIDCRMKAVCEYMTRTHSPKVVDVELEKEDDDGESEFERLEEDGRKIVEENEVLEKKHLKALWVCCAGQTAIVACLYLEKHDYKVWEEELEREEMVEEEECSGSTREVGAEPRPVTSALLNFEVESKRSFSSTASFACVKLRKLEGPKLQVYLCCRPVTSALLNFEVESKRSFSSTEGPAEVVQSLAGTTYDVMESHAPAFFD
ncbi:hypothetical protein K435DRAFT_856009 [Dendrothele bispora CBS 962.96]|uniref:Uncharacterized protein n=1 Tax=Dendrothele bispora (strain CBS 962.96) TaxID=1314807 RepID=A0A4S8M9G6_DENBC|nr:hypothetical protein K435DRAFT_856009 [Dendrothele bispora CBS 962.96]